MFTDTLPQLRNPVSFTAGKNRLTHISNSEGISLISDLLGFVETVKVEFSKPHFLRARLKTEKLIFSSHFPPPLNK